MTSRFPPFVLVACLTLATFASQNFAQDSSGAPELRWWKGNLHTHSLWSDGDDFPEMIADWYRSHDYNFLALSDHNIMSDGLRWMKLSAIVKRAEPDVLDKYRNRFGNSWVETRGDENAEDFEVRLKPLDEFGPLLNRANEFLLIPGEEISDRAEGKPVHMNATNLKTLIQPLGGKTVREVMQNNLRSVLEQEKQLGREILPHLNHPNFGYAVTAEDLAAVVQERFFEVYNGHPSVNHLGDDSHQSVESMWDLANAIRLFRLDAEPLLGIATDDSHEYHGRPGATTGRGWVMVEAAYLTPDHLIQSMKQGRFYASSGVSLSDVSWDPDNGTLSIEIIGEENLTYQTEFIGIRRPESAGEFPDMSEIGIALARSTDLNPSYSVSKDVALVRARITSSRKHPNPSIKDQFCQAWTQPIVISE